MLTTRRNILSLVGKTAAVTGAGALALTSARPLPARAATDPNSPFGPRTLGSPNAPVTALEFFSLTCTHCAHFGTVTMPQVKPALIDTGKLQIIYHDFPLDQVALMAAQVARSLPADEYYPFIEALFASQDDWAFQPNEDYHASIFKYAALAGMDQTTYDAALANTKLKNFILQGEQDAAKTYNINATPTFVINGKIYPGAMEYPDFAAAVAQAAVT